MPVVHKAVHQCRAVPAQKQEPWATFIRGIVRSARGQVVDGPKVDAALPLSTHCLVSNSRVVAGNCETVAFRSAR
eukprot:13147926-Alexandrium_andersonii.AAC.1